MKSPRSEKLSFVEKLGYSFGDAAANFVFMSMILFQSAFYTDVFGLSASTAAAILLWPRLWDAFFDPVMGVWADRTNTRWGKFRPWVLWTAVPWAVVMVLAYTTPVGWSTGAMIAWAGITNTILMTLYSMNNMPYSALGGVITSDLNERAKLNSFRFVSASVAQFIVGGFTMPLVAKFAEGHDRQYGFRMTMTIWAVTCLGCFLITFFTTRERVEPLVETAKPLPSPTGKAASKLASLALLFGGTAGAVALFFAPEFSLALRWVLIALISALICRGIWGLLPPLVQRDFRDLAANRPWLVMAIMTLVHFAILSFRGGAQYQYFANYADKGAMFDAIEKLGLTAPALAPGAAAPGGLLEWLGYIVHGDRTSSNAAGVYFSLMNILGTTTTITFIILLATPLARRFGKKNVAIAGFALSTVNAMAFYWLAPDNLAGMIALTIFGSIVYAPTIPLVWAMFADVADYSEWQTGRRFTGTVYATIGFALKCGLAIGGASYLWSMQWFFNYDTASPTSADAIAGYRFNYSISVSILFAICTVLLMIYQLNKERTQQISDELAARRAKASGAVPA